MALMIGSNWQIGNEFLTRKQHHIQSYNSMDIIYEILRAFGFGLVIVLAGSKWLGDLWAKKIVAEIDSQLDHKLESYKTSLRKSEFYFQKQYEAVSALNLLLDEIMPKQKWPDMDWEDAGVEVAEFFDAHEDRISDFLKIHEHALSDEVEKLTNEAHSLARDGKFEQNPNDVTYDGQKLLKKLVKAKKLAREELSSQIKN